MQTRINITSIKPGALKAMLGLGTICVSAALSETTRSDQPARFTNQRMRVLHRHELERSGALRAKPSSGLIHLLCALNGFIP